jgi:hypothetical protein
MASSGLSRSLCGGRAGAPDEAGAGRGPICFAAGSAAFRDERSALNAFARSWEGEAAGELRRLSPARTEPRPPENGRWRSGLDRGNAAHSFPPLVKGGLRGGGPDTFDTLEFFTPRGRPRSFPPLVTEGDTWLLSAPSITGSSVVSCSPARTRTSFRDRWPRNSDAMVEACGPPPPAPPFTREGKERLAPPWLSIVRNKNARFATVYSV